MDELLQQIERLAAANQALTQRLDREHSIRIGYEAEYAMECAGRRAAELRAHEAEAALEALRADVERDRTDIPRYRERIAVSSVCELLAAWGRVRDEAVIASWAVRIVAAKEAGR